MTVVIVYLNDLVSNLSAVFVQMYMSCFKKQQENLHYILYNLLCGLLCSYVLNGHSMTDVTAA